MRQLTYTRKQRATVQKMADALNRALELDAGAINAIADARALCNDALADDPDFIAKQVTLGDDPLYGIGGFGLLNGCLKAAGLPLLSWSTIIDERSAMPVSVLGFYVGG